MKAQLELVVDETVPAPADLNGLARAMDEPHSGEGWFLLVSPRQAPCSLVRAAPCGPAPAWLEISIHQPHPGLLNPPLASCWWQTAWLAPVPPGRRSSSERAGWCLPASNPEVRCARGEPSEVCQISWRVHSEAMPEVMPHHRRCALPRSLHPMPQLLSFECCV